MLAEHLHWKVTKAPIKALHSPCAGWLYMAMPPHSPLALPLVPSAKMTTKTNALMASPKNPTGSNGNPFDT